jgi:hypothetical protein
VSVPDVEARQILCQQDLAEKDIDLEILIKTPKLSAMGLESSVYLGNRSYPVKDDPIFKFSRDEATLTISDQKLIGSVDFRFLNGSPRGTILDLDAKNLVMLILMPISDLKPGNKTEVEFVFKNGKRVKLDFKCQ